MCEGRGRVERVLPDYQVPVQVRNTETKEWETVMQPYVHVTVCGCQLVTEPPTADKCGLAGMEWARLQDFDPSDLLAQERDQAATWAALVAWAKAMPASLHTSGDVRGYVFHGSNGNGKTHLAAGLAHVALTRGVRVRFVSEARLFREIKATWADGAVPTEAQYHDSLEAVPLLVLDDIGKGQVGAAGGRHEEEASWRTDQLEQILDRRLTARRPLLVTTNVPKREWARRFGNATRSRLNLLHDLYFAGPDRR